MVGPSNGKGSSTGVSHAPIKLNGFGVGNPEIPKLSQRAGGDLSPRAYWIQCTAVGTGGGETVSSPISGGVGGNTVFSMLPVKAKSVLGVASPLTRTGAHGWNCYANYVDPIIYLNGKIGSIPQEGNYFFWDAEFKHPVFDLMSGATTISARAALTKGSPTVTGVTSLAGVGSIAQLRMLAVYSEGKATGCFVRSVDIAANALTLSDGWPGSSGMISLAFGHYLYCGFTYVTLLGDSANAAIATINDGRSTRFGSFYFQYNSQLLGTTAPTERIKTTLSSVHQFRFRQGRGLSSRHRPADLLGQRG